MRRLVAPALVVAAALAAGGARAAVVPASAITQAKGILGQLGSPDLAFAPTKLPPRYAYESFSVTGSPPGFDVSFADSRYLSSPTATREHEISFDTNYLSARAHGCATRAAKLLHVSGVALYAEGAVVWRCTRSARGHLVRESATGIEGRSELALVVASAKPL